ncbi:hypothetical protein [Brevibacillus borstelensis]|uniref:hypothetical protein n=1 Tax=Brevibacillus borstelensis TaxID=45462 RepID=UPI00287FAD31|nr:hypothetical protein [Brevibacillus borstelensis]MED1876582.1 hypothetical protein [Brevibacillus borstelensis]WNF08066.1 hypothetical protein RFB14_11985 [Brevibacillus borstelensis]
MYRKAYLQIWWGLLFPLISFRVQGIDLLPDFIGYVLLFLGFRALVSLHLRFRTAMFMTVLSVIYRVALTVILPGSEEGKPILSYPLTPFLESIQTIFHFLIIYTMYQAICSVAKMQGSLDFAQKLEGAQKILLYAFLAVAFTSPLLPHSVDGIVALLFIPQLIFIFCCLYSLILVRLAARQSAISK